MSPGSASANAPGRGRRDGCCRDPDSDPDRVERRVPSPLQSETQKRVERRILELADINGKRLGLSRRQFLETGGHGGRIPRHERIYGGLVFRSRPPRRANPS